MNQSFKLALAQMLVVPGAVAENLRRAEERIATAAGQGAEVVLLPEALDCGWTHPCANQFAGEIPEGEACRRLSAAARQQGVFVCAGLIERAARSAGRGTELFNAAVLIDPRGEVILHHRKINELDFGRELYSVGDRLGVVETPWGRAGLMICADAFAPGQVIGRSLALLGARFILSPCAWAVPADYDHHRDPYGKLWLENYAPVVREFRVWIAGCSNVGPVTAGAWAGHKCIGNSLVCSPTQIVAAQGSFGEAADEILFVRVAVD